MVTAKRVSATLTKTKDDEAAEIQRLADEAKAERMAIAKTQRVELRAEVKRLTLQMARGRVLAEEASPWHGGECGGETNTWAAGPRSMYRLAQLTWAMHGLYELFLFADRPHWCDDCRPDEAMPRDGWVKSTCLAHAGRYLLSTTAGHLAMLEDEL